MRSWFFMMAVGCFGALILSASGQQPAGKGKDKGPMLPPVNPAIAKADITITGLDGPGFAIAVGKYTDLIVVGCENGTLQTYDKKSVGSFKTGRGEPTGVSKGHQGPVREIAWAGGPTLVSAGADKKINFWKMPECKIVQTATVDFRIRATALSPDGKTFAAAGESNAIQLFDVASGKPTTKLTDKMDWTLCLAFSADSKQLLSGDDLGIVRLWDVSGKKIKDFTAQPPPKAKTPPPDPIAATSVAFAPDGKTILIGTEAGPIHFLNLADGKVLRTLTGHTLPVTGMVFHPGGTLLATCSKDRTVKLWNPAAAAPLKSLDGHNAWIEGIVFFDQATKLATVSADKTIRTWDLAEPQKAKKK